MSSFSIFKSHPWHGISSGVNFPEVVNAFIEIIPSDTVKYELDKNSGYCKIDRLQKYSNILPALYGFVPKTYCGIHVAMTGGEFTGSSKLLGDGDPLDICVLTERHISRGDIIVEAIPIGGLRLVDNNEVDDKIIAILKQDDFYGTFKDIRDLPVSLLDRLKHYFLTYKQLPDQPQVTRISEVYDRIMARRVLESSVLDYRDLLQE
ncbi:MAG: inorganic pyrophosphatase [Saprospiraceae bacterium]|nr:inorganic pyrophosphatase [Saprospiraceae bacterium]